MTKTLDLLSNPFTNGELIESPFDILVKNFFKADSIFHTLTDGKIGHPVDIYENDEGLFFEVACTGLNKKDVKIEIDKDTFKVSYSKDNENEDLNFNYHYKGIAKRAFNLGYKVSAKYNLSEATAEMKDGLLKISIPHAEKTEAQVIDIK